MDFRLNTKRHDDKDDDDNVDDVPNLSLIYQSSFNLFSFKTL